MYDSLDNHKQHATAKYLRRQKALSALSKKRGYKYNKPVLVLQKDSANEDFCEDEDVPAESGNNTWTCAH
jgi:hypothetical protein